MWRVSVQMVSSSWCVKVWESRGKIKMDEKRRIIVFPAVWHRLMAHVDHDVSHLASCRYNFGTCHILVASEPPIPKTSVWNLLSTKRTLGYDFKDVRQAQYLFIRRTPKALPYTESDYYLAYPINYPMHTVACCTGQPLEREPRDDILFISCGSSLPCRVASTSTHSFNQSLYCWVHRCGCKHLGIRTLRCPR